ncbi:MAG: S4 domain-containing protein, partial [Pseudomonadota bacterium]
MSGALKLRVDKWLWAARFFKTRSLAKAAIEGGKVQIGGQRVKVSREIGVGDQLRIRQGWDERDVIVQALSDQRRGAPEAQLLYEETQESVERRAQSAQARKLAGGMVERPAGR